MVLHDFIRFAQTIPDPILLVTPGGKVEGGNAAARSLFGDPASLLELTEKEECFAMLRMMSRSRDPIAGGATLRTATGELVAFRCDGALARPRSPEAPPLITIRFRPREISSPRFHELNEKVDALDREIRTRRRAEALLRAQAEALEMTAGGAPLEEILEKLILTIEGDALGRILGSILLYDASTNRLRHGAAPHLPDAYCRAIDGVEAGPQAGSCGTAVHRAQTVIVTDIERDPLWAPFKDLALTHGLHSCWSTPILSSGGSVLGTFAIYREEPGEADQREFQTVGMLTRIAALAIERDATERQRAELQQRERDALGAAETANQIKDEFLATVSHELRTPLMAIVGWATLLREMPHDEETREGLAVIESSARAQSQIIDDLLDFSRITADKLRIDIRPVGLETMIREAVETVRPAAESAGVTLEVELEPLPNLILGDPDRVRQMIWNLLTNAIKFAAGGKVTLTTSDQEGFATVTVSDTGEGIDAAFLPHVFDRFSQADPSRRRSHGGLGLGLSIVRRLVEMHHGSVEARSEGKGQGATFVIRLPYAVEAVDGDESFTRPDELSRGLSGTRILLVEDDHPAREVLRRMLAKAGATVSAASSAAEALEMYRRDRPDVVVSDIAMPEMDGLQLARVIRADHPSPRVPMIALTSYARVADRDEALASGFDAHLAKPVNYETLILAVRTAVAAVASATAE